ncbi:multi drug resistance-associated protein MRP [Backusella circina FSU 941]|nr:multi drug resistance-associated protein MRP [Backusella circina FSU 941]
MFVLECMGRPKGQYILLEEDEYASPEEKANVFSRLTFQWLTPLMQLGYRKPLVMDDLWNLKKDDQCTVISEQFQKHWQIELQKKNPSLLRAMVYTLGAPYLLAALFRALVDMIQFAQPWFLKQLMNWVQSYGTDAPEPGYRGVLIAVGMFVTAVCQTLLYQQHFQRCFTTGLHLRSLLVTAIYQKALVLSNSSRQKSTIGEIVNLMSVDSQRLMMLCNFLNALWSDPFQIAIGMYFLYQLLGPSVIAGAGVLVLSIPLNTVIARAMRKLKKMQMKNRDSRVRLMNEILSGIRVIKLYAWELPFIEKINHIRNNLELVTLKKIGKLSAFQNFTFTSIPFFVSLSTFGIYVTVSKQPLTSDIAFVAISLFGLLQPPLTMLPQVITAMIEGAVSLNRIEDFLTLQQLDPSAVNRQDYRDDPTWTPETPIVEVSKANFKWAETDAVPVLKEIDLRVRKGQLTAVVGRVASGKSTLISALLGDTVKDGGSVTLRGSVAYVPQQPWVMNATLRDNIVFGHRWDPTFYQQVIESCSLKSDLEMLSAGDQTEIGERGINLSGGQKARVSLARAIYARADIYLLDDPLSAVDAHVGRHIFDHVIGPEGILKNKARILVTHGISFLPRVDNVVMLREGQVILEGEYNDLMSEKTELYSLVKDFGNQSGKNSGNASDAEVSETEQVIMNGRDDAATMDTMEGGAVTDIEEDDVVTLKHKHRMKSTTSTVSLRRASLASLHRRRKMESKEGDRLITTEESAKGSVSWDVYKEYAVSCSAYGAIGVLVFIILSQIFSVGTNLWIKYWSDVNQENNSNHHVWFYLTIYAIIGFSSSISSMCQNLVLWVFCAVRSARILHGKMLDTVIRSPMSFYDTTPLGRILNRFGKDQQTVDDMLPRVFNIFFRVLFSVITTVTVIGLSTPLFLTMVIPLFIIYISVQRYYLETSRELKRLDSVGRSPIYSHFQETISGVSTIRAYEQQRRFMFESETRLDDNQRAFYPSMCCNRWLAIRLEFLGATIILGAASFSVISVLRGSTYIDAGLVGLSVSYALTITSALNMVIRAYCEIETNIVSVERVKEYIDLPTEKYNSHRSVEHSWPEQGRIEFSNYSLRYREGLDLVLRDISFQIQPREKVGIVGRTGAGKSSLSLGLFRIIESASGRITIDGVDISGIRLFDLRSRLTIIPQDPVLFAGTVRENLDPFGSHDDAQLWEALQHSHLYQYISKLDGKLNAAVLEGGENFSVGQRQLICLARALLRRTTVLVLDEATAAIDVETDFIIQETIRKQFAHCTILTIAHRINTIMDSDKVLVLDKGQVVEFDTPQHLLDNKDSIFYSMAKEAGQTE